MQNPYLTRRRTESVASTNASLSAGPADSPVVRTLLYVGDGAMAGAVLYFAVAGAFLGFSTVFSGVFSSAELVLLSFLSVVFLAIAGRELLAVVLAGRVHSNSAVSREWREVRRWAGVAVVAIPLAGILVVVTVLRWGWEFGWFLPEADLLALGTLWFGVVVRMIVRFAVSREGGSMFLPGTGRGVVGFVVLLVGSVAVLAWGGVPPDVLLFVVVGIGGYGLLYLFAAAGLD